MFVREDRYLVIKRKDIAGILNSEEQEILAILAEKITYGRKVKGRPELQCVVVEADWPEYEIVWDMLEKRCNSIQNSDGLEGRK